jgi:hypothetical protein
MPPMSGSTWKAVVLLTGSVIALTGCGSNLSRTLGFTRDAPDEFKVTTRAPLAMPPEFALSPPRPGVPRPQEQSERAQAEQALVPQMALGGPPASGSPGQQALVQSAGPPAPADIRNTIDLDAQLNQPHESFTDKLMFWRKPQPPGIVVDPAQEAKRLRENAALGQSPETGDTPIIQPKQRGWLEGLF